jgi:hypothetical protein
LTEQGQVLLADKQQGACGCNAAVLFSVHADGVLLHSGSVFSLLCCYKKLGLGDNICCLTRVCFLNLLVCRHLAILNAAASGLDYVSGRGHFAGNGTGQWQPAARSMLQHCGLAGNNSSSSSSDASLLGSTGIIIIISSSGQPSDAADLQECGSQTGSLTSQTAGLTSSDCQALLEGQCMAIVSTFNVWWGLCFTTFLLVIAEQLSQWQWLHTHGSWMMPGAPSLFRASSKAAFVRGLLLRLHCVLDVPLLLLWAGFSTAYISSFE